MQADRSIEVFLNALSGLDHKEELRGHLQQLFEKHGISAKIRIARTAAQIHSFAHSAARSPSHVVVAGGGDGTINTFAAALIDSRSDKTLAVLPLGTLNHFAQDLHIPLDLEGAVQVIARGHHAAVDVAQVNGHIFINNSSLGLYPQIVRERVKQQRLGHGKWPAFIWAALAVLRRYPFVAVRLMVRGHNMHCRTPFVFVGNNEYLMEGFRVGSRERLNAGLLSLYVTRSVGRWGLVRLALRALFGRVRNDKDFEAFATEQLKIDSSHRRLRVAFDGEIDILETPLHYRVLPGALRVLVPQKEGD